MREVGWPVCDEADFRVFLSTRTRQKKGHLLSWGLRSALVVEKRHQNFDGMFFYFISKQNWMKLMRFEFWWSLFFTTSELKNVDSNIFWFLKKLKKKLFITVVKHFNLYPYNGCRKKKIRRKKFKSRSLNIWRNGWVV